MKPEKHVIKSRKIQSTHNTGSTTAAPAEGARRPQMKIRDNERANLRQDFAQQASQGRSAPVKASEIRVHFKGAVDITTAAQRVADVTTTFEKKNKLGKKELDAFADVFRTSKAVMPQIWLDNHQKQCKDAVSSAVAVCAKALAKEDAAAATKSRAKGEADIQEGRDFDAVTHLTWDTLIPPASKAGSKSEIAAGQRAFENLPESVKKSLAELGKGVVANDRFRNAHPESQVKLLHSVATFAFFEGLQHAIRPDQTRLQELRTLPNGKDRPSSMRTEAENTELAELIRQLQSFQQVSLAGSFFCGTSNSAGKQPPWLKVSDADRRRGASFFKAWKAHVITNSGWIEPVALKLKPNEASRSLRTEVRSGKTNPDAQVLVKVGMGVGAADLVSTDAGQIPVMLKKAGIDPMPEDLTGVIGNFDKYIRKTVYQSGGLSKKTKLDEQTRWQIEKQADGTVVATYSIKQKQADATNTTTTLVPKQDTDSQNISSAAVTGKIVFLKDGSWEVRSPLIHVAPEFRRAKQSAQKQEPT